MTEPRSRPVGPRSRPYAFESSPSSKRRAAAPLAIVVEWKESRLAPLGGRCRHPHVVVVPLSSPWLLAPLPSPSLGEARVALHRVEAEVASPGGGRVARRHRRVKPELHFIGWRPRSCHRVEAESRAAGWRPSRAAGWRSSRTSPCAAESRAAWWRMRSIVECLWLREEWLSRVEYVWKKSQIESVVKK
jgi:hypothetical protein